MLGRRRAVIGGRFGPRLAPVSAGRIPHRTTCGRGSAVEHHLAKVRVAGSNPVARSEAEASLPPGAEWISGPLFFGGVAEWLGRGLQIPAPRFNSGRRLYVDLGFWTRAFLGRGGALAMSRRERAQKRSKRRGCPQFVAEHRLGRSGARHIRVVHASACGSVSASCSRFGCPRRISHIQHVREPTHPLPRAGRESPGREVG